MFRHEFQGFGRLDRYQMRKIPAPQLFRRFIGQEAAVIEIEGRRVSYLQHAVSIVVLACFSCTSLDCNAQEVKKPFTLADEIGLTLFNPLFGGDPQIRFSPDGKSLAVWSERGRLDLNCVEDSLHFYRTTDVKNYAEHSDVPSLPLPVWVVTRSFRKGPIIKDWRWLADSSGVAYLER